MSGLQFLFREQEIIHETNTSYVQQQNSHTKQSNYILLEKIYLM